MPANNYYSSVANTVEGLRQRGFTSEFVLLDNRLFCVQTKQFFCGDEFDILEVYSFESDRSDREQTVVLAVECMAAIKGLLFQNSCRDEEPYVIIRKLRKFWK